MNKIVEDLRTLVEDEGTRVLLDTDLIKEYITANIDLLVNEIRNEVNDRLI